MVHIRMNERMNGLKGISEGQLIGQPHKAITSMEAEDIMEVPKICYKLYSSGYYLNLPGPEFTYL